MLAKAPQVGFFGHTQDGTRAIETEIAGWLYNSTDGLVQSGPFEDMWLPRESAWEDTRLSPLLLGCYEEELHGVIEQQIARLKNWERQPNIAVIGCSEGYYSIGLARRLPKARVYALDTSNESLGIMRRAAVKNDVSLLVGHSLTEVMGSPDLIVMDCEGAEVAYLDLDKFPALASAHIIVEIHNLPGQQTDQIILDRFRGTHRIDMIMEGPRNPNKFKELCGMTADYRWMAVNEGRPCLMAWFSMTPRGMSTS